MQLRLAALAIGWLGCQTHRPPSPIDSARAIDAGRPDVPVVHDAAPPIVDAGPPSVVRVFVINAGTLPLTLLTNPDTNEILHTRHLREHPQLDASPATRDGELVKFFPVGQEPLCSTDGGVGYGGLGQPEPRTIGPHESIEFVWDGLQRHEVLGPRGVCQDVGEPEPGNYRFEFDQPYNMPNCTRATIAWPLPPAAPRNILIRCVARPHPTGANE
jgi:hypothetical protein